MIGLKDLRVLKPALEIEQKNRKNSFIIDSLKLKILIAESEHEVTKA